MIEELTRELAECLLEEAHDSFVIVDGAGVIVWVNTSIEAMLGYPRAELIGMPVEHLVQDRLRDAHVAARMAFTSRGEKRSMGPGVILSARRRDGSEVPVEISLSPVKTSRGAFVLASLRDVTERHRMLEALQQSEQRVRDFIEFAPDAVFVADLDGRFTEVNSAACRMLGYARDELISKSILAVVAAGDHQRLAAARTRLLGPGQADRGEWELCRKDGSLVRVEVTATIRDGHWQAFVRDSTDRIRAEAMLRASEANLQRAQRIARLGSWEWDLETNAVVRSPALYEIYGVPPAAIPSQSLAESRIPPDEEPGVSAAIQEAIRAGHSYRVEHRWIRPDGEERVFVQQGDTLCDTQGRPTRVFGITLDITELRTAESAREVALSELHAVLEHAPVGITILRGLRGEAMEHNEYARRIYGDDVGPTHVGQDLEALTHADGSVLRLDELPAFRALHGETVAPEEIVLHRPDGHTLPLEVSATPVNHGHGGTSAVVVLRDLSPQKALEQLRTEWNAVVAHDLRAPLNTIELVTQLLERQTVDSTAEIRKYVRMIRNETSRLARMTDDLLDLSAIAANRLELVLRPVDLVACVRDSIERITVRTPARTFDIQTHGEIPLIEGDPDRLAQVMENLLSNAVKYGRQDAPIHVTVERAGSRVAVAVSNEGLGIAKEDLHRLFKRFLRTRQAQRSGIAGIGLGLEITRGLVEAHGGEIGVTSELGGTTTFRFTLPLRE